MPAPHVTSFGATPSEAIAHSQMMLSGADKTSLDIAVSQHSIRLHKRRLAVKAASALEAGYALAEIADGLHGMSAYQLREAIRRENAKPDGYLVAKYRAQKEREPGLSLSEAAKALGLGTHAVMAQRRDGRIESVLGKNGIHHRYFLPETTNGSTED